MQVILVALVLALLSLSVNAEPKPTREDLIEELCSRDSFFRKSDGALFSPNQYLDGMLERQTDLAIYRMKNIVRMYRPEFFTYAKQLEMWALDQAVIVWTFALFGKPLLTPEYYMYKQFTEHREKLGQMLKEIADELCPEGREHCGIGKHNWSDTAANALRSQSRWLMEPSSPTEFEVTLQSMAGSKYYEVCVGTAKDWFSMEEFNAWKQG